MPTTRAQTQAAMAETGTAGIVPTGAPQEGGASTDGAIASAPPCANRNETLPPASRTSSSIVPQSARSRRSSSTLKAQILTAKAEHARRLAIAQAERDHAQAERDHAQAERDHAQAERENAVAELELQAKLAAIQANSLHGGSRHSGNSHSSRSQHKVEDWLAKSFNTIPKRDNKAHSFVDRGVNEPRLSSVVPPVLPRSTPATAYGDGSVPHPVLDVLDRAPTCPVPACALTRPILTCAPPRQAPAHSPMHPAPAGISTHPVPCACTLPAGAYSTVEPAEHTPHTLGLGTLAKDNYCYYKNKNLSPDLGTSFNQLVDAITGTGKKTTKVCDLTKFDGHVSDWFHFKKSYEQSKVHFSPSDNITRLGAALHGAAREAVSIRLISADDPELIVQALETRFAQPEVIVLHQISEVKALPKISMYESARELNIFACRIRNCVEIIRLLDLPEHLASPDLLNIIIGKLTPLLRSKWRDFASPRVGSGKFKLEILADFLEIEAKLQIKFDVIVPEPTLVKSQCQPAKIRDKIYTIATTSNTSKLKSFYSCQYCHDGKHEVSDCEVFKSLSLDDRWQWVMENKVCRRCLRKGSHQYRHCKKKCEFEGCPVEKRHHTLLHRTQPVTTAHVEVHSASEIADTKAQKPSAFKDEQRSVTVAHNSAPLNSSCLKPLLKVIAVTISGPLGSVNTYALLDDGSSVTLLDQSVADSVGAEGPRCRLNIDCIGGLSTQADVSYVNIKVKGLHSTDSFDIRARSIPNLGINRQSARLDDVARYDYLSDLVDVVCYDDAKPMLLIGADNWHVSLPSVVRHGTRDQPAAARTALGWVLYGHISGRSNAATFINHISVAVDNDPSLDNLIKEYFRLDSIGITKVDHHSASEQRALNILEETTKRLDSGRYEAGLLWRDNITRIPKSRDLALARFASLERKMAKDAEYADAYKQNIQGMISKGYAELCMGPPSGQVPWYLPHFGVIHLHKKKLRVVHDAAAKCAGVSLNSLLLTGPDLLQPLLSIAMRFREGPVALTGDIREMFPQIKIRPEDRDSQRFLWRDSPDLPLQEFRMSSMIFGAASSPCTALWVKNKNASRFQSRHPEAVQSIVEDHYMDDFLGSFDSTSEAAQRAFEIWAIHKAACFEMRSWVSNCKEALALIPADLHATDAITEVSLGPTSPSQIRVLGLTWNVSEDKLHFVKTLPKVPTKYTKRSVLSLLMSIYDPSGFLTPVIMKGRALFQKTWKLGIDWDQILPANLIEGWKSWLHEIQILNNSSIPRCYFRGTGRIKDTQLHVFADASERAYACVAYWRFTDDDKNVSLSLIGGKGRLAPLKPVSIPRLELQAALIASRFSAYVTEAHRRKPNQIYFWTDSLTVLKWLRSDACTFKAFVSFRVGEIAETTNIQNWKYVPTALNVADDATRDIHNFTTSSRWFTGPSFLLSPPSDWPCEPTCAVPPVTEELKRDSESVGLIVASPRQLPLPVVADYQHFSSWTRLLRGTARTHQYLDKFRSVLRPNSKFSLNALRDARNLFALSVADLNVAEVHLFRKVQLDSFPEDLTRVLTARSVSSDSRLRNLSLLLGDDGLLRLSGRTAAVADHVESRPIVLDGRHPIVKLLIYSYHVRYAHGHNELVVNELRQKFYVLSLRPAVRGTSQRCQFCRNRKAKPESPPEGDLPDARLAHHQRPFTHVGLDYFGPLSVSIGRRTAKRWIALFTCMTVRAVHLEIVESLTSDSALMALRRFIARRGCPTRIYSDNGTSFVGAAKMLPELFNFCANRKIEWRFIPPSAPFMGGCWERLVRSVKSAIAVTLKERTPKEEVLNTLLLEAESIVNSRPLTHVSVDADAEYALTPFTFLIGSPSSEPEINVFDDADLIRRANWRKAQRLADHFWQRFVREYLPTLTPRRRLQEARPLRVGDLVFIADGTLPRNQWPRGRIAAVHPGRDGVIRVVDVTTKGGVLRRPTRKVVLLVACQ